MGCNIFASQAVFFTRGHSERIRGIRNALSSIMLKSDIIQMVEAIKFETSSLMQYGMRDMLVIHLGDRKLTEKNSCGVFA